MHVYCTFNLLHFISPTTFVQRITTSRRYGDIHLNVVITINHAIECTNQYKCYVGLFLIAYTNYIRFNSPSVILLLFNHIITTDTHNITKITQNVYYSGTLGRIFLNGDTRTRKKRHYFSHQSNEYSFKFSHNLRNAQIACWYNFS